MAASGRVSIEEVVEISGKTVTCVVRCLEGIVSTGDVFDRAISKNGSDRTVRLRVVRILRYTAEVPFFDPPHAAKLDLAGHEAASVTEFSHLLVSQAG